MAALALAACGAPAARSGTSLASDAPLVVKPAPTPAPANLPPVRLPQDEGPHNVLAEWWYYTGHLYPESQGPSRQGPESAGAEYGFELVFFRGVRGDRPPGYAAHFAITDVGKQQFRFDQRQDVALNETASGLPAAGLPLAPPAPGADRPPGIVSLPIAAGGFDLALGGWRMRGQDGQDTLQAAMPGYQLDASLTADRPPALHQGDPPLAPGLLSFGPAGYSYYYSRTRMRLAGTLAVDGAPLPVRGVAWMDHQWGDFLVLGGGGWDWFAATLDDGRDVTLSLIRDANGANLLAYGTLVDPTGEAHHLAPGSFAVEPTGWWTSPHSGVRYPSGWRVRLPDDGLDLTLTPLLADQELDARRSSGVVYWEGTVAIRDAATGADLGRGYVELTGYAANK
jgi:predicted secreted hydrolase